MMQRLPERSRPTQVQPECSKAPVAILIIGKTGTVASANPLLTEWFKNDRLRLAHPNHTGLCNNGDSQDIPSFCERKLTVPSFIHARSPQLMLPDCQIGQSTVRSGVVQMMTKPDQGTKGSLAPFQRRQ
jgi:hypothetical protein